MKPFTIIIAMMLLCVVSYSQTFKSTYVIKGKTDFETEMKDRVITISDKEISISKFTGGTKTMYLNVDKIEEKDYSFDGKCKYYYCTTKDEDPINGYQKAIVIKKYDAVYMGLFATEIDMYLYQFSISKY
jgi:hypothetical protein